MAYFDNLFTFEPRRNLSLFLRIQAGLGDPGAPSVTPEGVLARKDREIAGKNEEISRLKDRLAAPDAGARLAAIRPQKVIWLFGMARTGSTWLSAMMGDLPGQTRWNEPYVGDVFGYAYYARASDWMRARRDFVMGEPYRRVWLNSMKNFFLDGALARFPDLAARGGYLVVKEPNGAIGAPLLVEALPESRMVLLMRDPRDVVASLLASHRGTGWGARQLEEKGETLADTDPDTFVYQRANLFMASMEKAREAYGAHGGPRVTVKYEDLRYDTLETMGRIYSALEINVNRSELTRVVEKHAWENVPESRKGADKPARKATPGGWREDLTPSQAQAVEDITAPILDEYYPGR